MKFCLLLFTFVCSSYSKYVVDFRNMCATQVVVNDARKITYATIAPSTQEKVEFDKNLSFRNGDNAGPILYLSQKKGVGHYRVNYANGFSTEMSVRPVASAGPTIICVNKKCQSVENRKVTQSRIGTTKTIEPHFEVTFCPR